MNKEDYANIAITVGFVLLVTITVIVVLGIIILGMTYMTRLAGG